MVLQHLKATRKILNFAQNRPSTFLTVFAQAGQFDKMHH